MGRAAMANVTVKDLGLKDMIMAFEAINGLKASAGVPAGAKYPNGKSVAEIAAIQEYGTDKIPSRPFMRQTFDKNKNAIAKMSAAVLGRIQRRKTHRTVVASMVRELANGMAQAIKKEIKAGNFTPNAPSTIARKGRSEPLQDTERMVNSIRGRVDTK